MGKDNMKCIKSNSEEGAENKSIEIAKEMKKQGFSLETISSIIKIPIDKLSAWLL